jgi:hypothetical protein
MHLQASSRPCPSRTRSCGAALVEFAVIGPLITLLGMALIHYGHFFFTKNHINHAAFMAARAGSTGHADLEVIRAAYAKALIPIYGGGTNPAELAASYARATADVAATTRIELLNPTKESFDDWNDEELQQSIGQGRRVIPNAGLAFRDPEKIGSASGQNIQDANLIRIRITHGYAPLTGLRFIGLIYTRYLQWLDSGGDDFRTALIAAGRIPVVTHATLLMQSEAIEPDNPISTPGPGNHGTPVDPGDPPVTTGPPPECGTAGCTTQTGTLDPGGGNEGGCTGDNCPVCGSPDSSG